MSVDYKKAAQVQQRATANQSTKYAGASSQPRVATGKPANPGVQGQRSSNPQYNNPYNTRNEQQRLEEQRFQQGRRDALKAQNDNRRRDDRAEIAANNQRSVNNQNLRLDREERQKQQREANNMARLQANRDWANQQSDRALDKYKTDEGFKLENSRLASTERIETGRTEADRYRTTSQERLGMAQTDADRYRTQSQERVGLGQIASENARTASQERLGMAQTDADRYRTQSQERLGLGQIASENARTASQERLGMAQVGVEKDRTRANSMDNLANLMGQLATAKGNQSVQREQIMAGLVSDRWGNDTQRQRNWLDGFSSLNNSFTSGNNYRYWG